MNEKYFYGDHKPIKIIENNIQKAGYIIKSIAGAGNVSFSAPYKAQIPFVKVFGTCRQDGTPTPETPVEPAFLDEASISDGVTTVPLPVLRALPDGSVRDEYDLTSGTLTRRIYEYELDGHLDWQFYLDGDSSPTYIRGLKDSSLEGARTVYCVCNCYRPVSRLEIFYGDNKNVIGINWSTIRIGDTRYTTKEAVQQFKDWLIKKHDQGNPVKAWYALKTPIVEHYKPVILRQHPGTTTLTVEGGNPQIEAKYYDEFQPKQ